jgi:hypothetical protein
VKDKMALQQVYTDTTGYKYIRAKTPDRKGNPKFFVYNPAGQKIFCKPKTERQIKYIASVARGPILKKNCYKRRTTKSGKRKSTKRRRSRRNVF